MMHRAAVALALFACACASSSAFKAGERAERRQDYDRAVLEYSRALQTRPESREYRQSLDRARLRASEQHARTGRRFLARGNYKEALDELKLALDLNPASSGLAAEVQATESARASTTPPATFESMKERTREHGLPGLVLDDSARDPLGLSFRGASLRETYQALGRAAGINFVFDPQFQDQTITLDLRDTRIDQALTALSSVGHTFHRVLDAKVVMVVPDTQSKRREYEQQLVKTFYLSNADLKETIDLLRIVLGARRVAPLPGANALTINDAPDKVAAAERIIEMIDKQRAEVVVEVEILEVNRTRLKEYGIQITSGISGTEGVLGAIAPNPTQTFTLKDNPYSEGNLVVTNLPGVIYRLLRTDTSTRLLANPQLRTSEGQTAQARFGDQVPVPVTVFSPIAAGGTAQQPITSFDYKNVGVNIDITPRVHHDGDVTLNLKLEISSVGPLFQNLPTFNSRTVTSVIRLHDGETNILAGLISDSDRKSITGLPGLSNIPVLGRIFSRNHDENNETDIVMTLTPHIVRRPAFTEEDLRSFSVGGDNSPLLFEVPSISPNLNPPQQPVPSPRIEPIRPPSPQPSPSPQI